MPAVCLGIRTLCLLLYGCFTGPGQRPGRLTGGRPVR